MTGGGLTVETEERRRPLAPPVCASTTSMSPSDPTQPHNPGWAGHPSQPGVALDQCCSDKVTVVTKTGPDPHTEISRIHTLIDDYQPQKSTLNFFSVFISSYLFSIYFRLHF